MDSRNYCIMRIKLLLVFLLLLAIPSFPISARPEPIVVEQEDGTYITIYLRGDEIFHYFITKDGMPLIQENENKYCYAISKDSCLISSGILAHNEKERNTNEEAFVIDNKEASVRYIEYHINKYLKSKESSAVNFLKSKLMNQLNQPTKYSGTKKGLVILVEFDDLSMSIEKPAEAFDKAFNESGYNKNNHIGSVRDYFLDQSYGKFDLSFDIVGPVKISKNYAYYGANNSWSSQTDIHAGQFVTEACKLADEFVDYSIYDWDGDGNVEQVFLIYAGYGESSGAPSYTIWPHKSKLYSRGYIGDGEGILHLDGVNINDYACACELSGTSGKNMNGIGTTCHEFSHCLGLPDFYDVNYSGGFGMNSWDLMDSGGHNGPTRNGEVPSGYSAYERWFAGWLSFTELNEMARIKDMECIEDTPIAYRISNDNNPNEYFILENRQNRGWFSYVNTSNNCHGMLVTHVDYLPSAWSVNAVNTSPTHQRMSIIPADNNYGYFYDGDGSKRYIPTNEDLEGDLFPGSKNIREFTNLSHNNVGGKLYNENTDGSYYLNKPITNIKEHDGLISFDFMGGIYVEKPTTLETKVLSQNSFETTWSLVPNADSYIIEATEIRDKTAFESIVLSENFNLFRSDEGTPDGSMDLSPHLNSYTQVTGWSGKGIYTSILGAKIGNDKNIGFIKTPAINILSNVLTVKLSVHSHKESVLGIIVLNHKNDTVLKKEIECKFGETSIHENFNIMESGEYFVCLNGNNPIYISSLTLYDGAFTEEETSNMSIIDTILKPLETYIKEGIKNTSYIFKDLKSSKFRVRVRAEQDEALSEWTDYKEVNCDNKNNINAVYGTDRQNFNIYNIKGQNMRSISTSGIYIINNGINSKKIIIK